MRRRNHEQEYGQEEGSEEEAGKVSAGKARREAGEETEPRVSGLRYSRPRSTAPIGGIMEGAELNPCTPVPLFASEGRARWCAGSHGPVALTFSLSTLSGRMNC